MKQTTKRTLSLLLALAMCFSLLPASALEPEETDEAVSVEASEAVETEAAETALAETPEAENDQPSELLSGQSPLEEAEQSLSEAAEQPLSEEAEALPAGDAGEVLFQNNGEAVPAAVSEDAPTDVPETAESEVYVSDDLAEPDELLYDYMLSVSAEMLDVPGVRKPMMAVGTRLTGANRIIYDELLRIFPDIAAGERSSTKFALTSEQLGIADGWNADELGIDAVVENGKLSTSATAAAKEKLGVNLGLLVDALMVDQPYHMYWYDKTAGTKISYSFKGQYKNGEYYVIISGVTLSFSVSSEYSAGSYEVDTSLCATVSAAAETAAGVVSRYATQTDYNKLVSYRDYICNSVSYNYNVSSSGSYGNPWQLIWVFDRDNSTNVVCEGYSKAFQYLCDLTGFPSIECRTVTGKMNGGAHMWNIVQMSDNANYLVDVTNCDTALDRTELFLAGFSSGSYADGYSVKSGQSYTSYVYDNDTMTLYTEDELTLSSQRFTPPVSMDNCTVTVASAVYSGTPLTPSVTVKQGYAYLTEGTDYTLSYADNVNAGTGTVTVAGMGKYYGTSYCTFDIAAAPLDSAAVSAENQYYTGEALTPPVTVTLNGTALSEGTDYTVSFANNTDIGTASFTVTGAGNYTGTAAGTFEIVHMPLTVVTTSSGNGKTNGNAMCAVKGGGVYPWNPEAEITVTAPTVRGYTFKGWYEADSDTALSAAKSYTFSQGERTGELKLVAVYETSKAFSLLVEASVYKDPISGRKRYESGTVSVPANQTVTVEYLDNSATFFCWQNSSGKILSREKSFTFCMTGDMQLKAFVSKSYSKDNIQVVFVNTSNAMLSWGTYYDDETIEYPNPPAMIGQSFIRWSMTPEEIKAAMVDKELVEVYPIYQSNHESCDIQVVYLDETGNVLKTDSSTYSNRTLGNEFVVTAEESFAGKTFSYWTDKADGSGQVLSYNLSYRTRAVKNATLYAVYAGQQDVKPTLSVTTAAGAPNGSRYQVLFIMSRNIPEGYTLVSAGVRYIIESQLNGRDPEEILYSSGEDNVREKTCSSLSSDQSYTLSITSSNPDNRFYLRGYAAVKAPDGSIEYYYSDVASASYNDFANS